MSPIGRLARRCGLVLVRSFFPVVTLVVVLGTAVWGPWVSLALALALWLTVDTLEIAL